MKNRENQKKCKSRRCFAVILLVSLIGSIVIMAMSYLSTVESYAKSDVALYSQSTLRVEQLSDRPEEPMLLEEHMDLDEIIIRSVRRVLVPTLIIIIMLVIIVMLIFMDNRSKHQAAITLKDKNQELIQSRKKYKELAYVDVLTELNNRAYLYEILAQTFSEKGRRGYLFFMDLDNFKYINDAFGHIFGDEVLRVIGQRLKKMSNDQINIIRIGGDEFMLTAFSEEKGTGYEDVLEGMNHCVEELIVIGDKEIYMTGSIGIVAFPENGMTAEELIRKADIAMYEAKKHGKGQAMSYSNFMGDYVTDLMEIQNKIRMAIERDQFELYLQPQVDAESLELVSFEGLIRWNIPGEGSIPPAQFIPVAEKMGLIHRIGRWVCESAFTSIQYIEEKIDVNLKIGINISAMEITRPHFATDFFELMEAYHVDPKKLVIELTESVFLEVIEHHLDTLNWLQDIGIEIYLDDFGTGYSSLNYLRLLPVDVVKVDRDFIQDININKKQAELTQSLIDITHNLGKKVIAEGVETKEQLQLLRSMGCDMIQGYYVAKPMTLNEAVEFVKKTQLKPLDS